MKSQSYVLPTRSARNRANGPSLLLSAKVAKSLSVGLAAAFAAAATMQAASVNYDGGPGGTGTNWGDAVNWSTDTVPSNTDNVIFNTPSTTLTINLGASREVRDILFGNANALYTIGSASDISSGYSLTVANVKRDTSAGGQQTLAANVVLSSTNSIWEINTGFNNALVVTGAISGASKSVNKWGGGTLTLGGSNTFNGGLSVNAGTVTLDFNQSTAPTTNIVASSNALTMGPGSLVANGKAGNTVSQTFASTQLDAGAASFSITNGNTANTRTLVNLGAISRDAGTTLNFTQPTGTGNTTIGATNGFTTSTANDASGILGGWATVGGTEWATNNGTNIVAYTGYTDLAGAGPTLTDGVTSNIRINGSSTGDVGQGAGTTTVNTIRSADTLARTITVGSGNTLRLGSSGGILVTGGTLTIGASGNAGFLTAGGADNTAGELFLNNVSNVVVNSVVTDNGTGQVALVKAGSGTATLNAASTNTGGTYVNAGALILTAGTDRLSTTGNISVYGGTLNLGTSTQNLSGDLIIAGGALNSSNAVAGGGSITNGSIVKTGNAIDARGGTLGASISGTVGINKTTAGALALSNTVANTFTGTTFITEGTVVGGVAANVTGISGDLVVGSVDGGNAASYRNNGNNTAFNGARNLTVYSNGSVNFGGGAQNIGLSSAAINVLGGTVFGAQVYLNNTVNMTGGNWAAATYGNVNNFTTSASADTALISGSLNSSSNKTFTVADGAAAVDLQVTGAISGTNFGIVKAGAGLMQVTGAKNFTGTTTVSAGILAVDTLANGGANSSIGAATSAAGTLQLRDGSTLRYTGAATSTDRLFTVGQNGAGQSATLDASGSGAVSFTGTGNIAWGTTNQTRTLILDGTNTGNNSLAAVIANNGTGAVSVTKNGSGKWILGGVNTYSGTTTINAGTLLVNGSIANSTVSLNGGVLGGGGTTGAVNVNSGGSLAPGASIGTLNTGALSFASGATFALEINTDLGTTDLINVTGNLSITGGALLTLSDLGTNVALNTMLTVIDYSGTWNGGLFTYNGDVLADGATFSYGVNNYTIDYDNGTAVTLAVAAIPEPATTALVGMALGFVFLVRRKRA